MDQNIRKQIIELFNLGSLPEDQQEAMIAKLGELVFQGAISRALVSMTEEDQAAIDIAINNNAEPDVMMGAIMDKIPNFMELVTEELASLKDQALAVSNATK